MARFVSKPDDVRKHPKNAETYKSDTFAMIGTRPLSLRAAVSPASQRLLSFLGTIFLWMFWPSFNAALAAVSYTHLTLPTN